MATVVAGEKAHQTRVQQHPRRILHPGNHASVLREHALVDGHRPREVRKTVVVVTGWPRGNVEASTVMVSAKGVDMALFDGPD